MSWVRITFRVLMVFALVGIVWLGYRAWVRDKPDFYWQFAQAAQASGNWREAELFLRNMIRQYPDDPRGHRALADVYLQQVKAAGRKATYATHPQALFHLEEAARLAPDDLPLQKELLRAYLTRRELPRALPVATRLAHADPDDARALLPLAWSAIKSNQPSRAEAFCDRIARGLAAKPAGTWAPEELITVCDVLLGAVQQAPDPAAAARRAGRALETYHTLAAARRVGSGGLANRAARVMLAVAASGSEPESRGGAEPEGVWTALDARAEPLRAAAIVSGTGEPLVYHQSARAAFARGDYESGLQTIRRGLEVAKLSPPRHRADRARGSAGFAGGPRSASAGGAALAVAAPL